MDPFERHSGGIYEEDTGVSDLPMPLSDDPQAWRLYEEVLPVPERNQAHLYENSLSALTIRRLSDCCPRPNAPPPLPARPGAEYGDVTKRFVCGITGPAQKLGRSTTNVESLVSMLRKNLLQ